MQRGLQNAAKHLKWSRKEPLAKNNYDLELLDRHYNLLDRDVNTVKLFEYSQVLNMPGIVNMSEIWNIFWFVNCYCQILNLEGRLGLRLCLYPNLSFF